MGWNQNDKFPKKEFKLKQQKNSPAIAIVYPSETVGFQNSET